MTWNNNVTMSSRSQSRSTRHQRSTSAIVSKISRGEPLKHLNMIIHSLYVMRCGYGSQCKSIRAGVMLSKRFKPKIKRAAELSYVLHVILFHSIKFENKYSSLLCLLLCMYLTQKFHIEKSFFFQKNSQTS